MLSFNAVIFASKFWFILLSGFFLLALAAIWLSAMPIMLSLVVTALCLGYGLYLSYHYWMARVVWLTWNGDDELWQFRQRRGECGQGRLVLSATFVSRVCLIIALRCADRRSLYFIPVFFDAIPSMAYRRLSVLLRAYPHNEAESARLL